jgi:hypothetical protein
MSAANRIRCPLCAHETPRPSSRDFVICTCGLRLYAGRPRDARKRAPEVLLGSLAVLAMIGAAVDLVRRIF